MPRLSVEEKKQISDLTREELEEIVIKLAAKEKIVYDFITVNYLNKEYGEEDLYEEALEDLDFLFIKNYKGYAEQIRKAKMLSACIKHINEFKKVCKNKKMEADLLLYVLEEAFSVPDNFFGTCFTQYDSKTAQIVKRLITLVTKNLHEDYQIEYKGHINSFLKKLHQNSDHINLVYDMPKKI